MHREPFGAECVSLELTFRNPGEDNRRVCLAIGIPYVHPDGYWACPCELRGLESRYTDIRGEDALQALCLALSFLRSRLEDVLERGGAILDADAAIEWNKDIIAAEFGRIGTDTRISGR